MNELSENSEWFKIFHVHDICKKALKSELNLIIVVYFIIEQDT